MNKITLYGLSTCIHCKNAKAYLDQCGKEYECIFVDKLEGEEKKETMKKVKELNPRMSFPTILVNDKVVVGFHKEKIEEALKK